VRKTDDEVVEVHLFFSNHEIKVFKGQSEVYCEIEKDAHEGLRKWTRI
jgi:hypothetical protein